MTPPAGRRGSTTVDLGEEVLEEASEPVGLLEPVGLSVAEESVLVEEAAAESVGLAESDGEGEGDDGLSVGEGEGESVDGELEHEWMARGRVADRLTCWLILPSHYYRVEVWPWPCRCDCREEEDG